MKIDRTSFFFLKKKKKKPETSKFKQLADSEKAIRETNHNHTHLNKIILISLNT
jgi:hypothetical protein